MPQYPYIASVNSLNELFNYFRRAMPKKVDLDVIKKYGLAPKNESYLLNILKFLNIIDEEGNVTDEARGVFSTHMNDEFNKKFSEMLKDAYKELFDMYGDEAWNLDYEKLVSYFRGADSSSEVVGKRQASVFMVLSKYCNKRNDTSPPTLNKTEKTRPKNKIKKEYKETKNYQEENGRVRLAVKIEINIPGGESEEVYDRIFRSIKKNLME